MTLGLLTGSVSVGRGSVLTNEKNKLDLWLARQADRVAYLQTGGDLHLALAVEVEEVGADPVYVPCDEVVLLVQARPHMTLRELLDLELAPDILVLIAVARLEDEGLIAMADRPRAVAGGSAQ